LPKFKVGDLVEIIYPSDITFEYGTAWQAEWIGRVGRIIEVTPGRYLTNIPNNAGGRVLSPDTYWEERWLQSTEEDEVIAIRVLGEDYFA
jgi:hypothetical protein